MRVGAVDIDVDAPTELVEWFHLHIHTHRLGLARAPIMYVGRATDA